MVLKIGDIVRTPGETVCLVLEINEKTTTYRIFGMGFVHISTYPTDTKNSNSFRPARVKWY